MNEIIRGIFPEVNTEGELFCGYEIKIGKDWVAIFIDEDRRIMFHIVTDGRRDYYEAIQLELVSKTKGVLYKEKNSFRSIGLALYYSSGMETWNYIEWGNRSKRYVWSETRAENGGNIPEAEEKIREVVFGFLKVWI